MSQPRASSKGIAFLFLFIALFTVFLYTFLHEGGHALVGLAFGGKIQEFNVNFLDISAHVGIAGDFTRPQIILQNVAGVALPFLVWLAFILVVPRRANLALEALKVTSALVVLTVFLVWIILPLLTLRGVVLNDDSTSFLNNSGASPLLVAGAALLLYLGGWALFLSRIEGVRQEIELFRHPPGGWLGPGARRTLGWLAGILVLAGLAAFAANGFRLTPLAEQELAAPPPGYVLASTIRLSDRVYDGDTLLAFTLREPAKAGIYLQIQDINTPYIDVQLAGPGQDSRTLLHGEGYWTNFDHSLLEEEFPPGEYRLLLTSRESPGVLSVYTKGIPKGE